MRRGCCAWLEASRPNRTPEVFDRFGDAPTLADSASITIAEAGKQWIAAKARAGREQATVAQYRQHVDLHIVPFIGTTKLSAFNAPALAAFEDRLHEEGRSPAMIRKVRVSLGSLIAHAQRRGLSVRNIVRELRGAASDARAEKRARRRLRVGVDIPSPAEVKALVATTGGKWRPILLTAIFCGLRASELRGLAWVDVDLEGKTLQVRQRADRFNAIGRPKSETSERDMPMPPILVNELRRWKLACPKGKLGLVFPNGEGNVESLGNIINRGLVPAMIRAGVTVATGEVDKDGKPIRTAKYTGMHSLRHFHASWLINSRAAGGLGLTPKEVQERLGHATLAMTVDTYSHLFPRSDNAEQMAEAERALLA